MPRLITSMRPLSLTKTLPVLMLVLAGCNEDKTPQSSVTSSSPDIQAQAMIRQEDRIAKSEDQKAAFANKQLELAAQKEMGAADNARQVEVARLQAESGGARDLLNMRQSEAEAGERTKQVIFQQLGQLASAKMQGSSYERAQDKQADAQKYTADQQFAANKLKIEAEKEMNNSRNSTQITMATVSLDAEERKAFQAERTTELKKQADLVRQDIANLKAAKELKEAGLIVQKDGKFVWAESTEATKDSMNRNVASIQKKVSKDTGFEFDTTGALNYAQYSDADISATLEEQVKQVNSYNSDLANIQSSQRNTIATQAQSTVQKAKVGSIIKASGKPANATVPAAGGDQVNSGTKVEASILCADSADQCAEAKDLMSDIYSNLRAYASAPNENKTRAMKQLRSSIEKLDTQFKPDAKSQLGANKNFTMTKLNRILSSLESGAGEEYIAEIKKNTTDEHITDLLTNIGAAKDTVLFVTEGAPLGYLPVSSNSVGAYASNHTEIGSTSLLGDFNPKKCVFADDPQCS